jgi:hypothetical protein
MNFIKVAKLKDVQQANLMKGKSKAERMRAEATKDIKAHAYGTGSSGALGKAPKGDKEMQDLTKIAKNGEQYLHKMRELAGIPSRKETAMDRV